MTEAQIEYLDAEYLVALNRRIRWTDSVINHEVPEDSTQNTWHLANSFLEAFEHLRRPDGYQLACVVTPRAMDSSSRMLFVRTDLPTLPELPEVLVNLDLDFSFTRQAGTPPKNLPDWIEWRVARLLRTDGTLKSYFERSIFERWIDQLLNFGHPVWWPRYEILRGDKRSAEIIAACDADGPPTLTLEEVRPRITLDGRTAAVEFFAYTQYGEERIEKYTDTYLGGAGTSSRFVRVARGNNWSQV